MKLKTSIIIASLCLLLGVLFFLIHRKVLVIKINTGLSEISDRAHSTADHKTVRLYFKKNGAWQHEGVTLIWHKNNVPHNLKLLINQWLTVATDERLIPPHVTLESVALATPGSDVYISFDRTLFDKNASIMNKWYVVESLMKTVNFAISTIHALTLQVHHQPMHDDHLELTQAIPIQEFCS